MAISLQRCTKTYFDLYLKEIEFRFNHRNEDIFRILAKKMVEAVPNSQVLPNLKLCHQVVHINI